MRRPQSAFGLAAVVAGLSVATLGAGPVDAATERATTRAAPAYAAPAACTPWTSQSVPPPTIRVLRSDRSRVPKNVVGTVEEVDFRDYVATVMAVEWPEHYPLETLKAGPIATKQFAWYYVIHPRGRKVELPGGGRACYDVVDTTIDQYYYPEKYGPGKANGPGPKIERALAATWDVTLRKYSRRTASSRFFLTGYRDGTTGVCGADANGFKLFHRSTRDCGEDGLKYREILRRYLEPNLEIVTMGRHDVVGTRHGDATAMVRNADGQDVARVWTLVGQSAGAAQRAGVRVASETAVGYQSADMDRDGKEDLVWLVQDGPRSGRVRVALSDGSGYGPDQTWFDGDLAPLDGARLVVGDFQADGRPDVAVLARGGPDDGMQLILLRKKAGGAFAAPLRWWSSAMDMATVVGAWAGDVSGDGRADLIVRQHPDEGGIRFRTALSRSPLPSSGDRLGRLRTAWETTAWNPAKVKSVAADANRDGREDMLLLVASGGRIKVHRLQGGRSGRFAAIHLWTAPRGSGIPVEHTRLGASDVDHDGRTDLVLFSRHAEGTRIRVLKTRYASVAAGLDIVEPLEYGDVRPY